MQHVRTSHFERGHKHFSVQEWIKIAGCTIKKQISFIFQIINSGEKIYKNSDGNKIKLKLTENDMDQINHKGIVENGRVILQSYF